MNITSRNYWSLYGEFLETFNGLQYKGFSIPYLCHFRSLIHDNSYIWAQLSSDGFINSLSVKVKNKKELQQKFKEYKESHINKKKSKLFSRAVHGKKKVVLYNAANLLRFPKESMAKYFSTAETILLSDYRGKNKKKVTPGDGVSTHYLSEYRVDVSSNIQILRNKADQIISGFTNHPMFNDASFKPIFFKQIEGIVNRIEEANRYFRINPVSCIVIASTHYYQSRTIAMVAAEVGIPTICMQHGIIGDEIGYMPKIADVDAVYGQFEVDWFKQLGVTDQSLEIVGHPRFDLINNKPSTTKADLEKQLGMDAGKKMILMIVRNDKQMEKWVKLLKYIDKKKYNIVVRDFRSATPHPLTTIFSDVYSSKHFPLYDLLQHSDLVVTYLSTVGLEAMLANKPVFILSSPFPTYTGYFNFYDVFVQTDPLVISKLIKQFFRSNKLKKSVDMKRKEFLSQSYPTAKLSGDRLMNLIHRLSIKG